MVSDQQHNFMMILSTEATIIELGADLNDLGVEPAALFNFGNLQG